MLYIFMIMFEVVKVILVVYNLYKNDQLFVVDEW